MYAQIFDNVESVLRSKVRRARESLHFALPRLDPPLVRLVCDSLLKGREGLSLRVVTAPPTNLQVGAAGFVEAVKLLAGRGFQIRAAPPPLSSQMIIDGATVVLPAGARSASGGAVFGLVLEGLDVVAGFAERFDRLWETAEAVDLEAIEPAVAAPESAAETGDPQGLVSRLNEVAGILTVAIRLFPKAREIKTGGKLSGMTAGEEESALRALLSPFIHHLPRFAPLEVYRQQVHREKTRITHSTSLGFLIPVYRLASWNRFFREQLTEFRSAFRESVGREYDAMFEEGRQGLEKYLRNFYDRRAASRSGALFEEDREGWVATRLKVLLKRFPGRRGLAGDYLFMYRINGFHQLGLADGTVRRELKPLIDDLAQRDLPLDLSLTGEAAMADSE